MIYRLEAELRRIPFEDEQKLCDSVASYLEKKLKVFEASVQLAQRVGLVATSTSTPVATSSSVISAEGGYKVYQKDNSDEQVGNLKKKANKAKAPSQGMKLSTAGSVATTVPTTEDAVAVDEANTSILNYLSVTVPTTIAEIATAVEGIRAKKTYFQSLDKTTTGVVTFNEYVKQSEKAEKKKVAKETNEVVHEIPVAPSSNPKKATIFTMEQLQSADLFPTL